MDFGKWTLRFLTRHNNYQIHLFLPTNSQVCKYIKQSYNRNDNWIGTSNSKYCIKTPIQSSINSIAKSNQIKSNLILSPHILNTLHPKESIFHSFNPTLPFTFFFVLPCLNTQYKFLCSSRVAAAGSGGFSACTTACPTLRSRSSSFPRGRSVSGCDVCLAASLPLMRAIP